MLPKVINDPWLVSCCTAHLPRKPLCLSLETQACWILK